jgi:uncharacterized protein
MHESSPSAEILDKEVRLLSLLADGGKSLLAYSGGVDSAYLAALCHEVLGEKFLAVLADSPSLSRWEKDEALAFAEERGFELRVVETRELESEAYRRNSADRCFHCKAELFGLMEELAGREEFASLLYGGNLSDRSDFRPGHEAARKFKVRAPLGEVGLLKEEIRALARARGLSVWNKPARACLASRIPHFSEVTETKLGQVESAEALLHELGFRDYRVRHHGQIARIELAEEEWGRFADGELRTRVARHLRELGFASVALDLEAFESGRLSRLSRGGNLTDAEDLT